MESEAAPIHYISPPLTAICHFHINSHDDQYILWITEYIHSPCLPLTLAWCAKVEVCYIHSPCLRLRKKTRLQLSPHLSPQQLHSKHLCCGSASICISLSSSSSSSTTDPRSEWEVAELAVVPLHKLHKLHKLPRHVISSFATLIKIIAAL